jgi:branched-chain amino acid transport system substrate-binding protein
MTFKPVASRSPVRSVPVALAIGLAMLLVAAAVPQTRAQPASGVKIGMVIPLSGPWARQGQVMRAAAELAVEHINERGGIASLGGAPLELVVFDTGDSVERARNAAQRMVANHRDMVGATGSWLSSFTLAVSEVTERAELPLVTLSYSDLITGRGFNYIYQTSPTGVQQAEAALPILIGMAEDATGTRPQRIGIVMDNTAASVAFVQPVKEGGALAEHGLTLTVDEVFTPPLANATPLIQRVRSRRPDVLLLLPTTISDSKLLLEKMNEFGLGRGRVPTVSNGAAMGDPDLLSNMSPALLEGVMSIVGNWSVPGQEEIEREFSARTGELWLTQNSLSAYGHIQILAAAIELAGEADRNAVNRALKQIDVTDGPARYFAGGRIRFDEHGRRPDAEVLVIQWQNGRPVTVYPPQSAGAPPQWPN